MVALSWELFVLNYHSWISPTAGKVIAVFGGVTLQWVTGDTQACQMSQKILKIMYTIAVLYLRILCNLKSNVGSTFLAEELKGQIGSCLSWKLDISLFCVHYTYSRTEQSLACRCQGWIWTCPEIGKELKEQWSSDVVCKVKNKWPRKKGESINGKLSQ